MTIIPDTPFDADGWGDALTEIIYLRKQIRALQLQLVGESNDLNADTQGVSQATKADSGLTTDQVQALIDASVAAIPSAVPAAYGVSVDSGSKSLATTNFIIPFTGAPRWNTVGSAWNSAGSVFTAPAAGVYLVQCYLILQKTFYDTFNNAKIALRLNGNDLFVGIADTAHTVDTENWNAWTVSINIMISLAVGDTVDIYNRSSITTGTIGSGLLSIVRVGTV